MERPAKKFKNGINERLAAAASAANPAETSELCVLLLQLFAWGALSAQMCQRMAQCASNDIEKARRTQCRFTDLEGMAAVGAHGTHSNNCHRDLMGKFCNVSEVPRPFQCDLPFLAGFEKQEVLLPHEMFACIYNNYRETWNKVILPDPQKLPEFWRSVELHPSMVEHPVRDQPGYTNKAIPLGMHGDEVPVTGRGKCWSKSFLTFSWTSLLGVGSTADCLMWIWACGEKYIKPGPDGTLDAFFKLLVWSFRILFAGVYPDKDHNGVLSVCCNSCFTVCCFELGCSDSCCVMGCLNMCCLSAQRLQQQQRQHNQS